MAWAVSAVSIKESNTPSQVRHTKWRSRHSILGDGNWRVCHALNEKRAIVHHDHPAQTTIALSTPPPNTEAISWANPRLPEMPVPLDGVLCAAFAGTAHLHSLWPHSQQRRARNSQPRTLGAGTGAAGLRFSVVVGSSRQRHRGTALSKLHMNHSSVSRLPRHGESVPVRSAVAARRNSAGDETRGSSTPCRHAASDAIPSRTWQRTRLACSADCTKREFCGSGWRPSL